MISKRKLEKRTFLWKKTEKTRFGRVNFGVPVPPLPHVFREKKIKKSLKKHRITFKNFKKNLKV